MTENHSAPRRRSRRLEQAQYLDSASNSYSQPQEERADLYAPPASVRSRSARSRRMQQPEQPVQDWTDTPCRQQEIDYSAYYSREAAPQQDESVQPSFAPPPKLDYHGYASPFQPMEEPLQENIPSNVYRPRQATWADEARQNALAESEMGYQVKADKSPSKKRKKKKRHPIRNTLVTLLVLALIGGAAWYFHEPLLNWLKEEEILPAATEEPFVPVVTPEPIKAYDAAPAAIVAESAQSAIRQLSGTVQMDTYAATDKHVVMRHLRPNGKYDFYLFTAPEGRLLCYFEGLGPMDMIPQEGGSFYVNQSPYLVSASGSALIRTDSLAQSLGEELFLHPLSRGWAVVESREDGSANYINPNGQLLSTLWFSRTFPFTADYTAAYVDTGSTADPDQRYLLYVLGTDGTMSRWQAAGSMDGLVACAGGMAYMDNGDLYRLPDTSAPVLASPQIDAWLDCDAMVVQDAQSGKYGLFVHGEQHYDFAYDAIHPVDSDITWAERTLSGTGGSFTVHAVEGAAYPQPLSHSFVLEKNGQREYVALSTQSSYPIRLEGEF